SSATLTVADSPADAPAAGCASCSRTAPSSTTTATRLAAIVRTATTVAVGRKDRSPDQLGDAEAETTEGAVIVSVAGPGRRIARHRRRFVRSAGEQGLEPQIPAPEAGVLPITPFPNGWVP